MSEEFEVVEVVAAEELRGEDGFLEHAAEVGRVAT